MFSDGKSVKSIAGNNETKVNKHSATTSVVEESADLKAQNLFANRTSSVPKSSNDPEGRSFLALHPSDCRQAGKAGAPMPYYTSANVPSWKLPSPVPYYGNMYTYGHSVPIHAHDNHSTSAYYQPSYWMTSNGRHFAQLPQASLQVERKASAPGKPPAEPVDKKLAPTKSQIGEYINPEILYLAEQLNLPPNDEKFTPQNWKDCLALMYRWKVTDDDVEQQRFERSVSNGSSLSYSNIKSVKSFCDKVLCRPGKRRQFSIHWNKSGIRFLADKFDHGEEYPAYDSPEFQAILDNFAMDQAKNAAYKKS
ncbi:hypothetical protein IV203_005093 [Nitzschia inconspicua]|uniref:Uncharacterized protein n=1 Tax=Nitzschia inconspicua TaxID=303405 RepID=A0A9K3KLQ7_9STRA|nr:hypothetical protein IV203_005093 [Nitzschia inconspicua]